MTRTVLEQTVREDWGRLTSALLAQFRRLDLVEDALGEAVAVAADRWRPERDGPPDSPVAWLMTAARRRILDRLRAETVAAMRRPQLEVEESLRTPSVRADPGDLIADDVLRLVLMCTHPALNPGAASALSLRLVLGVSTADIARLFLVSEPTMAARLTRAKKKIVAAGIPFALPDKGDLGGRLEAVAQTSYLAFTAGYAPGSGDELLRTELAGEAIRLVRVVWELRPKEPVLIGLLALMLLQHSRRDARVDADGSLVLLPEQNRARWRQDEITEALTLLDHPTLSQPLTVAAASYVVQARIAAEHARAPSMGQTRWDRVVEGYDLLLRLAPSPSAQLARAVALAEHAGPAAGLAELDTIDLVGSHRFHAVRADLLTRTEQVADARSSFRRALELCGNAVEREYLQRRLDDLDEPGADVRC